MARRQEGLEKNNINKSNLNLNFIYFDKVVWGFKFYLKTGACAFS